MSNYRTKKKMNWKSIVGLICIFAAIIGIASVLGVSAKNDTKTIKASAFSVGALDENGKYKADDQAIYTEEAFECIGLRIRPDFEAQLTYDVYYYDYDEKLVEVKTGLTEVYDEDFPLAKLARVVIYPAVPEGETSRSFKISALEAYGFARQLKITVDKDQNYPYGDSVNLYKADKVENGKTFNSDEAAVVITENESSKVTEKIAVSGEYDYYDVYILKTSETEAYAAAVIAATEGDEIFSRKLCSLSDAETGEWCKITVELTELESECYLLVHMPAEADCYIYGYNK